MLRQSFCYASLAIVCLVIEGCDGSGPATSEEVAEVATALRARPISVSRTGSPVSAGPAVSRTISEIMNASQGAGASPYSSAPPHVAPEAPIGPPTRAAGASEALAAAAAPAALAASPPPSDSFLAAEDSGWIPPDTNGAVGPNHLVVALNGRVRFQTRTGQTLNDFTLAGFFGGGDIFDPLVRFDPLGNRFVMTAMADRNSPNSAVVIAVSQTSDPTGTWSFFRLDADPHDFGWADFPKMGIDNNWVTISANLIGGSDPAVLFVCGKAALYGGAASCRRFATQSFSAPAIAYDPALSTGYIARNLDPYSGTIAIDTITGPVGSETLTLNAATVTLPATWSQWGLGNFAPQSEIPERIETDFVAAVATLVP